MKTFFIFEESPSKEMKQISLRYRAEVVNFQKSFGGDVKSMYVILRKNYLVSIFCLSGDKRNQGRRSRVKHGNRNEKGWHRATLHLLSNRPSERGGLKRRIKKTG